MPVIVVPNGSLQVASAIPSAQSEPITDRVMAGIVSPVGSLSLVGYVPNVQVTFANRIIEVPVGALSMASLSAPYLEMVISWPESLPTFLVNGYSEVHRANKIETTMEIGPRKQRKATTGIRFDLDPMEFVFTASELTIFKSFYRNDLQGGVFKFSMIDPVTSIGAKYRFTGAYSVAPHSSDLFSVSVPVEKLS